MKKHLLALGCAPILALASSTGYSQTDDVPADPIVQPWMDTALPAPERTEALLGAMNLNQKIQQLYNFPILPSNWPH